MEPSSNPCHSLCITVDHRVAQTNLETKVLVGKLCRLGDEIRQITAKKSKTRTNGAHVTEDLVTCKLIQWTRMIVDAMLNIDNTAGRPVDMMRQMTHCMVGFARILCTVEYNLSDNYTWNPHLTHATACV